MEASTVGTSALFVGIMGALWARRANRSALTWFLFGAFLPPIACIFAYLRNRRDLRKG